MSIFNQKSKFKVKTEIRTVRQAVAPKPKPPPPSSSTTPSSSSSSKPRPAANSGYLAVPSSSSRAPASRHKSASPLPGERSASRKRALPTTSRRSPASPSPLFDDDAGDDEVDDDWEALDARKRRKGAHPGDRVDLNRQLCHPKLGAEGEQQRPVPIIHAVDVASVQHKCQPVLGLTEEEANIRLQYPGTRDSERYVLLLWMGGCALGD